MTLSQLSCAAGRRATLVFHLYSAHEPPPEFLKKSPRRSHEKALGSDQHSWRPTDKLQILSWHSGPARGSDQRALADHFNGPWHIICIQEGAGFVTGNSLERTSTSPPSTTAPCSSTRTPSRGTFCARRCRFRVRTPTSHGRSKVWMSLTSSAELPTLRVHIFTIANIVVNNEWAKRQSVCIALLLLIRDLCSERCAVVLSGEFNKAVERELPAGDGKRATPSLFDQSGRQSRHHPVADIRRVATVGPQCRASLQQVA